MQTRRSLRGLVSGRVQGVGFRYFVMSHARAESVCGYVRNLADGRVEFHLQGEDDAVERVLAQIRRGPDFSRISDLRVEQAGEIEGLSDFVIRR